MRVAAFLSLFILSGCRATLDDTIANRDEKVRLFIEGRLAANEFPGVQYVVVNRDSVLFSYAGGRADIAGGRALQESTTMMVYSMTKTITAAAVLQLIDEGKVSLDDALTNVLDSIPYEGALTIRHLLSQTSGIPNPIPLGWVHLVGEHPDFNERKALREVMEENPDLEFAPGEKYAYSNISYWLLGRVIEAASGIAYEDYVRQNVVERLGLAAGDMDFVIPSPGNHAKGYLPRWSFINLAKSFLIDSKFIGEYEEGWLHVRDHYLNGPAFGGIVASARSVGRFLQDQLQDSSRLFSRETRALFYRRQFRNDGDPIPMTAGWHIGEHEGIEYFFKEGGGGGFHCEMRVYPTSGTASVVIANNTTFDARGFLNTVDMEFLGKP